MLALTEVAASFAKFKSLSNEDSYAELLNIDGIGETQINSIKNFFLNKINFCYQIGNKKLMYYICTHL